jgi:hypothetical protein
MSLANRGRPAGRSVTGNGAAHAILDHDVVELEPVDEGVALDLAALHIEAFASLACLAIETLQYA